MAIEVVPLSKSDIPDVIDIIQTAFADDPYFKWVFNSDTEHTATVDDSQQDQEQGRILGVSCWLPPHSPSEPSSWTSWFQDWVLTFRQVFNNIRYLGRGGLNVSRYYIWKERQGQAQKQIWTDPHGYYFCNMVAVSPEAQGKGVGGKLFKVVTERADREGFKCYLESSKSVPNVEIYRRMGFEMSMEMECRDGEDVCMLYCMVREPRNSSNKA